MKIGFTGSRSGITVWQRFLLRWFLYECYTVTEAHHGNCLGADSVFAELVYPRFPTVAHPCDIVALQLTRETAHAYRPVKPSLQRNQDIVNECDVLIACPDTMQEQQRSGTWSTVRYARRVKKPCWILFPDGSYQTNQENET